jgi:hypothetical protein
MSDRGILVPFPATGKIFLFSATSSLALGSVYSLGIAGSFTGSKVVAHKAGPSPQSDAKVKSAWSHTPIFPYVFMALLFIA